ncbi:MAG: ABC transporter ATP-binding protein [Candidatus Stygibacter australis]|nr:ABC transporter ATP-binding protein [Candidatus Stygibacter australis]MDP8321582.1 ABC transporter ATP-binding protein [Candidatus Stygibacter australis]
MNSVIEMQGITKNYQMGEMEVRALRGIDLKINSGEFVAIMGASGSGKSTLMNIIGCLDVLTEGEFYLDGENILDLDADDFAEIRNRKIGFVFQGFNLLARTTALENVELPLLYNQKIKMREVMNKAKEALALVGLEDRMDHEPSQLSGGQQQRVAIARALVNDPALILADEPTGNLDSRTSVEVMKLFQELNDQGITIILVTHERDLAEYARRKVVLKDGHIIEDSQIAKRRLAAADLQKLPEED